METKEERGERLNQKRNALFEATYHQVRYYWELKEPDPNIDPHDFTPSVPDHMKE